MGMMGIVWRSTVLWMLLVCEAEGGRARRAAVALTSQSSSLFFQFNGAQGRESYHVYICMAEARVILRAHIYICHA